MTIHRVFSLLAMSLLATLALADEAPEGQGLRVNGFGTLGLAHADTDFGGSFRRDISQEIDKQGILSEPDSRLGVQLNYAVNQQVELTGQLVLKKRLASNQPLDSVEWAFVSYRPLPDVTLRAGRISTDFFLVSDYRNVGFGYVPVRPNVDFYSMISLQEFDGLDMSKRWTTGETQWQVKAFTGKAAYQTRSSLDNFQLGEVTDVMGVVLGMEQDGWLARATLSNNKLEFKDVDLGPIKQALASVASLPVANVAAQARDMSAQILSRDIDMTYASFGVSYDKNNWLLCAEWMRTFSNAPVTAIQANYAMVGRRFGNLTLHTGISAVSTTSKPIADPQWAQSLAPLIGPGAAQQVQLVGSSVAQVMNAGRIEQNTVSLGLRWDFDPRMALKAQWDHVNVKPNGNVMWSGQASGGQANVVSVAVDFLF